MGFSETILFYLLFGVGIATAVLLKSDRLTRRERAFQASTAIVFWPLYLPLLLQTSTNSGDNGILSSSTPSHDALSAAIAQAEAELDSALKSLDGWAEDILALEQDRFAELRAAWKWQAARIRQLDVLLAQPGFVEGQHASGTAVSDLSDGVGEPSQFRRSERTRKDNIRRLREVRHRMHTDLLNTLAWVRELVTMIHLAKFTGAPASRADELVTQIAAAVEGLSEVSLWRSGLEADAMANDKVSGGRNQSRA